MGVSSALIAAGANLAGDAYMAQGAAATNAKDMAMMYAQDNFNARQSLANKRFQANQAAVSRNWSAKQVALQDAFQERMADTQMQRRVADLRRAHLNPALAYGEGGAASPSGATPMTSTPSGSSASSSGIPNLQNPNLGFGALGGQVASAAQLRSTINLQDAQANKLNVEANDEIPASIDLIKSQTAMTDTQASVAYKNLQLLEVQLEPVNSSDVSMAAVLQKLKVQVAQMTAQEQKDTLLLAIKARNSQNFADSVHADNIRKVSDTWWGQLMAVFQTGEPAITSARAIGATAADAAGVMP